MAILDIRVYPDPVLRNVCEEVRSFEKDIQTLIDNMTDTMINAPGVGLAAPQVGVSQRIIVFGRLDDTRFSGITALLNPEIISMEDECSEEEGCLSVPEIFTKVKRAQRIGVRGLDRFGGELIIEAEETVSRVLQHEIDHLNGFIFWDRVGAVKREMLKRKYKKNLRQA